MSATRERSRQAFKMLEWRLMERALPDGIKKRRRTAIASLPRERKEFLDRELARQPLLLDHEPLLLDDFANRVTDTHGNTLLHTGLCMIKIWVDLALFNQVYVCVMR